jgi:hypothetical protein
MHHLTHGPRRYIAKITRVLSAWHRISSCSRSRWVIGAGLGPGAQSHRSARRYEQAGQPPIPRSDGSSVFGLGEADITC